MQCLRIAAIASLATLMASGAMAAPVKTLRYILPAAEASFDPALARDYYTGHVTEAIFETLYTYDYLARPVKLAPQTAAALPQVSSDGKTYLIRLKKGSYFTPDPAFGGKPRELTVADYVYSWKRLFDPRLASPNAWLLEGKVIGLDALAVQAQHSGRFDYEAPVAGLEVIDPYTLRIHLTHTDFNLGMILAYEPLAAVAREVVQKYGDSKGEVAGHPVGTGPYQLGEWLRGSRIVLEENTGHRPETWDFQPSVPGDERIVAQMKGKKMPQIGRIEISVQLEDQSRWLSFISGGADIFWLEGALSPKALVDGKLRPELAARGVQLSRIVDPELSYYYWNMRDPVVGGLSKEKIALRRAIAMTHDVDEEIRLVLNGEAQRLYFPIPPGVAGHDVQYQPLLRYDPVLANQLLDRYGYRKGADGWRTLPDGKPLRITYTSRNEANGVLMAELWRKTYHRLGIHMENQRLIFSDIQKAEMLCKMQARTYQWLADYPDGDNFMQLFYSGNIGQNSNSCYQDAQFDAWFEASHSMPPGPERDALYRQMARQLEAQAVVMPAYSRYRNMLAQPTVLGYKKHPILHQEWKYIDIERTD
jgi:ABC-type transport system substrate-binding protein